MIEKLFTLSVVTYDSKEEELAEAKHNIQALLQCHRIATKKKQKKEIAKEIKKLVASARKLVG